MTARRVTGGSVYVGTTVAAAAVAAWPVYASGAFVLTAAVGALAGAAVAAVAFRRSWSGGFTAAVLAGVFLVLAVPLAVPSRLGGPLEVLRGLGDALAGVVFAWKDLVTVELPVGSYRNLLVPALVVFLAGTCAALLLSWRADRWALAAAPVGLGMLGFGLFFGRAEVSAPLEVGALTLYAPLEALVGVVGLTSALLWLAWRTHDERVRALDRAAASSGVRTNRRSSRAGRRRAALGAGMIVVALTASVLVVPALARGAERDVLRSAAGPERDIAAAVSPLARYRTLFAGDDAELFRVSGSALPERIRVATLDVYDGEVFRAGSDAPGATPFVRVPSELATGAGAAVDAEIAIVGLEGLWMPTAGRVASVDFAGPRAAALADGFYYSASAQAGVQTADGGWREGDAYRVRAVEPRTPDLADLRAPGGDPGGVRAPENLREWVAQHATGSDGAALAGLVALLRERGYLSHALDVGTEAPAWTTRLAGYSFQPSAAGHSLARVDTMFARLLEREGDPRAEASGNYVAAVGDDEQFAVAVALIARELGFPARVVVGARLSSPEAELPTCDAGVCRAFDLAAWTEVRGADGSWVPVDVTPQWERSPSLEVTEQRDPENVTEVRPDRVEEVVPPAPVQEDNAREDDETGADAWDLAWLWPALRITGIVLLVALILAGPFVAIIVAKALRRRARRSADAPAERITGGWDEYVDASVDAGRVAPPALTRSELAAAFASAPAAHLATVADRAVFSHEEPTSEDADAFWRIVEAERRALTRGRGLWQRVRATVSLRSFVRFLKPRASERTPRNVERGTRRTSGRGRTTS